MNFYRASNYFIGAFLTGLLFFTPGMIAFAETESNPNIEQIKQNDVIYLGEIHDRLAHHQQQLEIITRLQQNSANDLAIAMEMFQRPFQPILNRYLEDLIDENQLRQQTEYDTRWGFDWEFYAPILRFAKADRIPVIALNTPEEITRKVAEQGINNLEGSDFRYIPPLSEIDLDNREYRQRLADIYQQHVEEGQGNSKDADNFFAAQVLWDETMAMSIANYYQNYPQAQIVVLVGKAHVMYDYAIPERVDRRIDDPSFMQTTLLLGEAE